MSRHGFSRPGLDIVSVEKFTGGRLKLGNNIISLFHLKRFQPRLRGWNVLQHPLITRTCTPRKHTHKHTREHTRSFSLSLWVRILKIWPVETPSIDLRSLWDNRGSGRTFD